jgi:hypothetical protein
MTELMHHAVIKRRELMPLPGEFTRELINGATLPVKIEAMRRQISECTELPELMRYKAAAEGLAAAVRIIKEVGPEQIRCANEMVADAWRRGGELLMQYSGVARGRGKGSGHGTGPSPRAQIYRSLGLSKPHAMDMVRIAKAPLKKVYQGTQRSISLRAVAMLLPRFEKTGRVPQSDAMTRVVGRGQPYRGGLSKALYLLHEVDLSAFAELTPDERKIVKAKITEAMEMLDEMDRLLRL